MKRIAIALLATAAALAATSARADTRVSIGVNVGNPGYRSLPPAVVYAPPPVVAYAPAPRGYWKDVTVKTWMPERWVAGTDRWGRRVRVCEPGYFAYRTDRVWVAEAVCDDRHDDRNSRGYAYNGRFDNDRRGYEYNHRGIWNR